MHAQLESERVEEVIKKVGSSDLDYHEMVDETQYVGLLTDKVIR